LAPYRESARTRKEPLDETEVTARLEPLARRRVALALILGKIIEVHNLSVDPVRVRSAVEDLALSYEQPSEVVRWYYAEKSRLREIENAVMEDQVVELVLRKGRTTEETIAFDELMNSAATHARPSGKAGN